MSMPSRSPSRSSMMTCSCIWTSSCLPLCCFISSRSCVSRWRSASSASAIVRIFSSRACTRTSHFCFSARRSRISSLWFASGPPSRPSAFRSFMRFTSSSMVSRCVSASSSCCCRRFTSWARPDLASLRLPQRPATSSSSCRVRATCGLPSTFCARSISPARRASTCFRSSAVRVSASTAARWRSSSCAVRSCSSWRSDVTSCESLLSFSSWRLRTCISSSKRDCRSR
mmetsp:Transcript_67721/g.218798  ORF Transcript_67721/g.218798 Transcript_67721/m.218798 type:complete len:228 (-) Transcript_67721:573-1256(-)